MEMIKKQSFARKVALGCLGFFGLFVICCLCTLMIAVLSPTRPATTITKINTPEPITTLEPHAALKLEIERVLGSGNRNVPRLTALNFDDPEKGAIFINWAINDNLGESLIIFGAKSDATDILKALAQSGFDYTYVILSGSSPMSDKFGNSKESNVVNLTFYKKNSRKYQLGKFLKRQYLWYCR